MGPVLLLDAYSLLFRAHYALPPMNTSTGEPTSALYGFSTLLLKVLREHAPRAVAVAFDAPGPAFRHQSTTWSGRSARRRCGPPASRPTTCWPRWQPGSRTRSW